MVLDKTLPFGISNGRSFILTNGFSILAHHRKKAAMFTYPNLL
jgi:hypothetical protein